MRIRSIWVCLVAGVLVACGNNPGMDAAMDVPAVETGGDIVDVPADVVADVPVDAADVREGGADVTDAGMDVASDVRDGSSEAATDVRVDAGPRTTRTINNCDPTMAMDLTGATTVVITSGPGGEFRFDPSCFRVRVGQRVTFRIAAGADWSVHPLQAGEIDPMSFMETMDPTSPVPYTDMGTADITVTFTSVGSYGFYCTRHFLAGHLGAVHVVP